MKNRSIIAVTVFTVALCFTFGAGRASAQGPAGAGAGTVAADTSNSSSRSYNPIHWVKKSKNNSESSDDQNKRLTANLQSQGVLPAGADISSSCTAFKNVTDCVAALHVSHNLSLDFNCLKSDVTGVQTGADMSACKGPSNDKSISLVKAIELLKPNANAKAEAKNAENQAHGDLKQAGA